MLRLKKRISFVLVCLIAALYVGPVIAAGAKVNINTAPKEELVTLKYVGDVIADRIIEYRNNSPFEVPEAIMDVKGIGTKIFEANKDRIVVKDE